MTLTTILSLIGTMASSGGQLNQSFEKTVELQNDIAQKNIIINDLNKQLQRLIDTVNSLDDTRLDLLEELDDKNKQLEYKQKHIINIEFQNNELRHELDNVLDTVKCLDKELDDKDKQLKYKQKHINNIEFQNNELRHELDNVLNTVNCLNKELDDKDKQLEYKQKRINNIELQNNELRHELDNVFIIRKNLNDTINELNKKLEYKDKQLEYKQKHINNIEFENNKLRHEVDNVFIKNVIIQKNLENTIKENNHQLDYKTKQHKEQIDSYKQYINDIKFKNNKLKQEVNNINLKCEKYNTNFHFKHQNKNQHYNINLNKAHSNSSFIQPITSKTILEKSLKTRKQSGNNKIVKIIDSPDITFQKVNSNDTNQSDKLKMTTKLSSSIFIKTNQIIDYKTSVPVKKLYRSEIKSVTNLPLPKTKNNVKNSFNLAHEYKKHFPKPYKTTTPLYEILKHNTGNIKSTYHTNQKKRSYQQTLSVSANRVTRYYIYHNDTFAFCLYASATYIEAVQKGSNKVNRFLKFSYKIKCKFKEKIKVLYLNLKKCRNKFVKRSKHIVKTNNQSLNTAINISFDSQQQYHRSNS